MQGRSSNRSDAVWKYSRATARFLGGSGIQAVGSRHLKDHAWADQASGVVEHMTKRASSKLGSRAAGSGKEGLKASARKLVSNSIHDVRR